MILHKLLLRITLRGIRNMKKTFVTFAIGALTGIMTYKKIQQNSISKKAIDVAQNKLNKLK